MDPLSRGPDWMPITPKRGSLFHADSQLRVASILGPLVVGNLVARGDLGTVFLVFGLTVLFAAVVVALFAVETQGRVLEEVSP